MVRLELATPLGYKLSALAIELFINRGVSSSSLAIGTALVFNKLQYISQAHRHEELPIMYENLS